MSKVLRYSLRILAGFLILWLILGAAAYVYVQTHKPKLMARANTFLNSQFKGSIHIRDISVNFWKNFPYPALQLNGVTIDDSVYAKNGQHTVYLEKVRVVPGFKGLLSRNPVIRKLILEDGLFYLYRDNTGYSNEYVWATRKVNKQTAKTTNAPRSLPQEVQLDNIDLTIADSVKHKLYSFAVHRLFMVQDGTEPLDSTGGAARWRTDLDVTVRFLSFSTPKGSWIKDQEVSGRGFLGFSMERLELSFDQMDLDIQRQRLLADGAFRFDSTHIFRLHIDAPSLVFAYGRSWLPYKIGAKMDSLNFGEPFAVDARIDGLLSGGEPKVLVHWDVSHNTVSGFIGTVYDCSFKGYFNNHIHDSLEPGDPNSLIHTDTLTGKYENSIAVVVPRLEIQRFDTAILSFDLSVHNDIAPWQNLLQSEDISLDKGQVDMALTCSLPLSDDLGILPAIGGSIRISDAELTYVPRQVKITRGQVQLDLDRQDVILRKISGNIGKSSVTITGEAHHFLTLASMDTAKMVLDWHIYSPALDVSALLPFLGKGSHSRKTVATAGKLSAPGRFVDRFLKLCKIKTQLQVDKLTYQNFNASQVSARLLLDNGALTLPQLSLNTAKGNIVASGSLRSTGDASNKIKLNAAFNNIDLPTLFYAFDNFGQRSLGSQNIQGVLNAQADLSLLITDKGKKIPGSLDGSLQFSVGQGALLNFAPLSKLSNFAFKKRDFSHVYFSKLYDTFAFSGDTLSFHRMEIQSTVLEMFVEGVYKMDGDFTDAVIQVPLNNLTKGKGLKDNVGVDTKHGLSIYVRAYNTGDQPLQYKFGLLKKKVAGIKN
jgi:hypothetical protein